MTALLQKAFDMASKLPSYEQEYLALRWIDELESDQRWQQLFHDSKDHNRGTTLISKMRGKAASGISTDSIMDMTRGE